MEYKLSDLPDLEGLSGGTCYKKQLYPSIGNWTNKLLKKTYEIWENLLNIIDFEDDEELYEALLLDKDMTCTAAYLSTIGWLNDLIKSSDDTELRNLILLPNKIDPVPLFEIFCKKWLAEKINNILNSLKSIKDKQINLILNITKGYESDCLYKVSYILEDSDRLYLLSYWIHIKTISNLLLTYWEWETLESIQETYFKFQMEFLKIGVCLSNETLSKNIIDITKKWKVLQNI
jgi:hypothetical protein